MTVAAEPFQLWEGLFKTYEEALDYALGEGFASDAWIERSRAKLQYIETDPHEMLLATSAYLLPVVAALLAKCNRPLRVLDYGGGPASGYKALVVAGSIADNLEYHIVDNAKVVALARETYGGDKRLHLHEELPSAFPVDLIHMGSCVQYIVDLAGLLGRVAAFEPRVMLFSDVFAGDIDEYWTTQNLWGSRVPFHFIRESDFVAMVERHGVKLRLCVPYLATIRGKIGPLPMDNFPRERRIARARHYLFVRP